jgi:hypothetical protein
MALDPQLLAILVCPKSKRPLVYFEAEGFLFCPDSRLKYRVEEDIPVMLVEEAELLDEEQCGRLLALARERGLLPV